MQIILKNVSKSFYDLKDKTDVLYDINMSVEKGKIVAIVGPSGCGKSTLANCILKLITPDGGEILFDNQNILNFLKICYKKYTKEVI